MASAPPARMKKLTAIFLALAVACSGDKLTDPQRPAVEGTWTLETIGGLGLPYLLDQSGDDKLELLEASLIVEADSSFKSTSKQRLTVQGQAESQDYTEAGTYMVRGSEVWFRFASDNGVVTGQLRGDSLTFGEGGIPVVYRRQ